MTDSATVRVLSPEEIAARSGGETPFLNLPVPASVFAERQMRLRQLANGHAMREFLLFMSDVARAQHACLASFPPVPVPDRDALGRAVRTGRPPMPATEWPRDAAWWVGLRAIVADLGRQAGGNAALSAALGTLASASDDWLEAQADALLTNVMHGLDLATAPIVGAALQAYWTHMVCEVQRAHVGSGDVFGRIDDQGACPCCGSRPTASITRTSGGAAGQRYLHCSLCSTQWHLVRIRCAHCLSSEHIAYQSLERADADEQPDDAAAAGGASRAAQAAVQAETCDDCGRYLKILHTERDPFVEPVADDLATVTLDLLVSESGRRRHGVNLLLLFGDPGPPDPGTA